MSVPSETLSNKVASRQTYIHEYVEACTLTQILNYGRGISDVDGMAGQMAVEYPAQKLEEHINKRASEGWNLAFMEPHWHHESRYGYEEGFARPLAIVGWYLTFKRKKRKTRL